MAEYLLKAELRGVNMMIMITLREWVGGKWEGDVVLGLAMDE